MPHCVIEYAKNLEDRVAIAELVASVHKGALSSELFEPESIKTRALPVEHYQIGMTDSLFVHVTLRILHGRNHNQKKDLSRLVLASVKPLLTGPISLSVEVVDIDKVCYSKALF